MKIGKKGKKKVDWSCKWGVFILKRKRKTKWERINMKRKRKRKRDEKKLEKEIICIGLMISIVCF
ncbi:hypothetical protein PP707_05730, partial [Acetobacter pasteurianus]|nr:hypothetical protein [Acetobacter pasteurianus]